MNYLDWTFQTPEENLACDEVLLDHCDQGGEETLRFWHSPVDFVVLGYSNKIQNEVNEAFCKQNNIPVLKRSSGGGTILLGPGCLNYALILQNDQHPSMTSVKTTTDWIMERHRQILEKSLGQPVQIQGESDLTLQGLKFSGNAQRRKKNATLFHGTFLIGMDLSKMEDCLKLPVRQPAYRNQRLHSNFIINLSLSETVLKQSLRALWEAPQLFDPSPDFLAEVCQTAREKSLFAQSGSK